MLGLTGAIQANATEQAITQERVEAALRRHTLQYGPWKTENVELRLLPFAATKIPAGPARYQVLQPTKLSNPGMHNFQLAIEIAGKEAARLWVKAEIRVFEHVVVAAAPLARQELIGAQDLRVERREMVGRGNRPFTRIEDVIGKQSTRAIEANEVLTPRAGDRPTLMKRGSAIRLVFETGSLRVETAGVAEEGGKIGDLIQVKNSASGKILRGVVLDGRQVRLN
jgi:flagella basal body P-ring formation protein FlgA